MDTPANTLQLGFIVISIPNVVVIGLMILVFAAALVLPMPHEPADEEETR